MSKADLTVNERRLRPIYDCLDNGNNKKALQEADKVLRKQKDFQCAKVLKCLALLRLGRQHECSSLLAEVHKEAPTDDSTLQAMSICYRELHKPELIADCYENAIKKEPQNEELLSHLFMSFVRLNEYKKQQKTAINLYKLKPKNPYYFWSVMSIYMQAISTSDCKLSQNMLLPLAEKMVQKFIDEGKIEAEAEVQLYLMVLEKQNKLNEMIEVLNGPLGSLIPNHLDFLSRRKAFLFLKLERWQEAFDAFKNLIENNIDQLEYYLELFKIAFTLDAKANNEHLYTNQVMNMLMKLITKLDISTSPGKKSHVKLCRGPYLAKIELYFFLKDKAANDPSYNELIQRIASSAIDLFSEFYRKFGHKPSCFHDLSYLFFKYGFSNIEARSVVEAICKDRTLLNELPVAIDELYRHQCLLLLKYSCGLYDELDEENKYRLISSLIDLYDACLKFGEDLLPSDIQPSDTYALLALHLLLDLNIENDQILLQTLLIAERMIWKSPSNFNVKLILIKLYNVIGAFKCSLSHYESMDIKHIQQETLGYLISNSVITSAHFHTSAQLLAAGLKFYTSNNKDIFDSLISCYKYGSFTKVEEITELRNKLYYSLQYCLIDTEKILLDLLLEVKNHQTFEDIITPLSVKLDHEMTNWSKLSDNRDISIFQCFKNEVKTAISRKQKQNFEDEVDWLKLRSYIVRAIIAAFNVTQSSVKSEKNSNDCVTNGVQTDYDWMQTFKRLVDDLKDHRAKLTTTNIDKSIYPLQAPQPSRLAVFVSRKYTEVILKLMQTILDVNDFSKENVLAIDTKCCDIYQSIVEEVVASAKSAKCLVSIGRVFEELSNCVDILSLSCILMDILCCGLKRSFRSAKKSKKKKDTSGAQDSISVSSLVNQYETMLNEFEQIANNMLTFLKEWNFQSLLQFEIDFSKVAGNKNFLYETQGMQSVIDEIRKKVDASYAHSRKELVDITSMKLKYLSSLKV
ncbi:N-alpha-acetyltransferase 25: NatB auxiliary subunit-like protein [Dinothrombium tinctorium]|uniref:N-terminal acetyltransferase B complex subunit MDM20 homolog n=1 Tax=Dinothrombium tinctorium TaxID=1965070 RepID=A0A3S3NUK0_9ACAR|nr:N-alpha-acetyltransferase 25: NatB auxiliary subunit-like protein [Dinothrombium tinctorium]RWS05315.1 N-alpha-acetyltransferase 25: NatB auxiliary subunit-like protein [Dinothrombium tinctorium]RWS06309.1 N-alpha-acetyltransferase 25: NatB auxiliary subunit-like protein [Dinothrombium tinctorium]